MRALVQRVSHGKVEVDDRTVGAIDHGFVVLLGVTHNDGAREADWLAQKIVGLRVFEDISGKMNASLVDVGGRILLISQFTLYGDTRKGRRPSFTNAARPEHAEPLVNYMSQKLESLGVEVATGEFGAHMAVTIHNDGPVTLLLEREAGSS